MWRRKAVVLLCLLIINTVEQLMFLQSVTVLQALCCSSNLLQRYSELTLIDIT